MSILQNPPHPSLLNKNFIFSLSQNVPLSLPKEPVTKVICPYLKKCFSWPLMLPWWLWNRHQVRQVTLSTIRCIYYAFRQCRTSLHLINFTRKNTADKSIPAPRPLHSPGIASNVLSPSYSSLTKSGRENTGKEKNDLILCSTNFQIRLKMQSKKLSKSKMR